MREIASMISIVACCHGAKLYAHDARDFRWQHDCIVPRQNSHGLQREQLPRNGVYRTVAFQLSATSL